jgi:hypothetical protein
VGGGLVKGRTEMMILLAYFAVRGVEIYPEEVGM